MLTLSAERFAAATAATLFLGTALLALGAERLLRGSAALGAALLVVGLGVTIVGLTLRIEGEGEQATLLLLTRDECAACDEARVVLDELRGELGFALWVVDVDERPELVAEHGDELPVVYHDGAPAMALSVTHEQVRALLSPRTR